MQRVICCRRGQAGLSHRTVLPHPRPGMGLAVSIPVMEKDSLKFVPSLCEAGCGVCLSLRCYCCTHVLIPELLFALFHQPGSMTLTAALYRPFALLCVRLWASLSRHVKHSCPMLNVCTAHQLRSSSGPRSVPLYGQGGVLI